MPVIPIKKQLEVMRRVLEHLTAFYAAQVRLSKIERPVAEDEFVTVRAAVATLMMAENGEAGSFLKKLQEMPEDRQSAMECVLLSMEENARLIEKNQSLERMLERIRKQLVRRGLLEEFAQEQKNEVESGS